MTQTSTKVRQGLIYQSVAGFYYIWSKGQSYATKPKGLFRHTKDKPLVGDQVRFEIDDADPSQVGRLNEILPRHNALIRPSIANVDHAILVVSLREPDFSYNLLDYFLVTLASYKIEPVIVLTKYDLLLNEKGADADDLVATILSLYQKIGYQVLVLDQGPAGLQKLKDLIQEGIYLVTGQSGVGKSTLLNRLIPQAQIATQEISQSLNRGRHTTREVTLYPYGDGFLADTPGFSALSFDHLEKKDLASCFPEIRAASQDCRFRTCLHLNEPHCQVKALVEKGEIATSRYQNYLQILDKIMTKKITYK